MRAAQAANGAVEIGAQPRQMKRAALAHAIFADEADRQAQRHQLQRVESLFRLRIKLAEKIEEALAAPGLLIKGADQPLGRPVRMPAPGVFRTMSSIVAQSA